MGSWVASVGSVPAFVETFLRPTRSKARPEKLIVGRMNMERTTLSAFGAPDNRTTTRLERPAWRGLYRLTLFLFSAFGLLSAFAQMSIPYSATGTFVPPTGVTSVTVECWGGGGRGGTRTTDGVGGGGGGGAYARSVLTVVPGTTYTVTVGAGSTTTAAGGDSWFNTAATILAKGGSSAADNSATGVAGGTAGASIGTTKFAGGTGGNGAGNNAGGGGSSAGTAAAGNNGGTPAGGNAPAGGGDGGDGTTTQDTDGNDGVFPGGGGGGARRNNGTRTGGAGGGGMVRISYTYTSGTCLNAGAAPIADNGCGSATLTIPIVVSGQPTTLGAAAGNARINSVGLIIGHTFNSDLDITLTSPAGTTRNLILDRFGNGDNLGNPASCPGSALILQDGGTALSNANTSNVTGTYAPQQTLAGFTGNPNGTWILTICDDAANDVGDFRYFSMDFCTVPTTANANSDQAICAGSTATLAANNPSFGTGAWSVVSGPSTSAAQFSSTSANNAVFTPVGGTGAYTLRWTITNGTCSSTDDVVVTVNGNPTTANAGSNQTVCSIGGATLAANTPGVGTGAWSVVSGPSTSNAQFSSLTNPTATFTPAGGAGSYVLRWTISSNPCTASTSDVTIAVETPLAAPGTITGSGSVCASSTGLGYSIATVSGATSYTWTVPAGWTITGGQGTTSITADAGSTGGNITVVAANACGGTNPSGTSNLVLTPTVATNNTGYVNGGTKNSDGISCNSSGLNGYVKFPLTGLPTGAIVTAANLALTNNNSTTLSGATNNITGLANTDPVSATAAALNTAIGGGTVYSSATWSNTGVVSLNLNATAVSDIQSRLASPSWLGVGLDRGGTATYNFFGYSGGANAPKLTLTYTQPRNLAVTVSAQPTTADAGINRTICATSGSVIMAANTPAVGTGAWSQVNGPVTATIATASSPTTSVTGMTTTGTYVFRWTISNAPCTASTSDMSVTVNPAPTAAAAGSNQTICSSPGSVTMSANTPVVGTGAWTQISGPVTATITTPSAPNTTITGLTTAGSYVFRWTISNAPCTASISNVTITVNGAPTTANAGSAQSVCVSVGTVTMAANTAAVGVGAWSQVSGPATASIVSASSPTTVINGLTTAGTFVFRWTISNSPCTASTSDVNVVAVGVPTSANAGPPQSACTNPGTVTMAANNPSVGTGTWSQLSGPVTATIANANANNTGISGLTTAGNYVFRWTISNSPCASSQSSVTISVGAAPSTADAGVDQAVCVSPGTTTLAANTPVDGTGNWSQVSGPLSASIADASDPATGIIGLSAAGTYTFRWTISSAGCTASTDDVDIVVSASPSTASAGPNQIICLATGSATMAANTPAVGTGAWSQISGPATASFANAADPGTLVSNLGTAGTYVFRWTISNGSCSSSTDDVSVESGGCTYYSQGSGDVSDAIWSTAPVGTPDFATFVATVSMVVQSGHTVTNTAVCAANHVTVDNGGTLVLGGGTTLQVNGNATFTGALTADDNSELELVGANATTLTIANNTSFYELTVNTAAGTTLTGAGVAQIRGTLLLQNGNFDCTGHPVTLRSTASYTGRLGPVAPTASYTGNMRMERFVPAGATNWRLLGSPIASRRVGHWQDDFITAGFPGSTAPNFDNPVGSGILWPSVRWYNETDPGAGQNDGMTGVSSNTHALTSGQGFAAWCGTGLTTTTAFLIDLENQAPVIANTPITLPMTYTNTGNASVDGWNLVSNPVPSPIAFDQLVRGADVADYVTFYDPATGNNAVWDISLGSGTNGATNTIQSSQGFFLKATGPDVTTTVSESAKVADNGGGFFGGLEEGPAVLRLQVASTMNTFSDETLVVFSEGSPATDGEDVPKYVFSHPDAPQIASIGNGGQLIAINAYGAYSTDINIPIMVDAAVTGTYTVTATGLANLGLSCLRIEDLLTGAITPLNEGATYSFSMDATADASAPRLMLHASAPLTFTVNDVTCNGLSNGLATVNVVGGPADLVWMNDMGATIAQQSGVEGESSIGGLAAGDYQVSLNGVNGCATMSHSFHIAMPEVLAAQAVTTADATCANTADGAAQVTVQGGVAPYSYAWSNGSTDADLIAPAGTYHVVVTDANNCTVETAAITIDAGASPVADASAQVSTVLVNTPVVFINNSVGGSSYLWDFADGNTSDEMNPEHSYALPGVYSVSLTASEGACSASTTIEITVETSTGVVTSVGPSLNAWVSGDYFVVEHTMDHGRAVNIDVMNAAGQVVMQERMAGTPGRITLPTDGLATGIWFLRVSTSDMQRTFSLPVAH